MRGRTNVLSRVDPSDENININANVETYEVYKDQSVFKGHMVDFITEKTTADISIGNYGSYNVKKFIFKLSNNKIACFVSVRRSLRPPGYLSIIEYGNNQLTNVLSNYSLSCIYEVIEISQDNFLIFETPGSYSSKLQIKSYFLTINTDTNGVVTKGYTLNTSLSDYAWDYERFFDYKVKKNDNNIYAFLMFTSTTNYLTKILYVKIDFSGDNISNFTFSLNIAKEFLSYTLSSEKYYNISDFYVINDNVYVFYGVNYFGKENYKYNYFRYIRMISGSTIGSQLDVTNNDTTKGLCIIVSGLKFKLFFVDENNNVLTREINCETCTASSFNPIIGNVGNINELFNIPNGSVDKIKMFNLNNNKFLFTLDMYYKSNLNDKIFISEIVEEGLVVYEYKEYNVENPDILSLYENDFLYLDNLYNSYEVRLIHFIVENNIITGGDNTNKTYVKNASSLQYIRGIAKESGTSGQIIDVYIPKI